MKAIITILITAILLSGCKCHGRRCPPKYEPVGEPISAIYGEQQ